MKCEVRGRGGGCLCLNLDGQPGVAGWVVMGKGAVMWLWGALQLTCGVSTIDPRLRVPRSSPRVMTHCAPGSVQHGVVGCVAV